VRRMRALFQSICGSGPLSSKPAPPLRAFRLFLYGFRPGRNPHHALDALAVGLTEKRVSWVLDADVRDFSPSLIGCGWETFLSTGSRINGSCG
jgi:hypothetical protein